MRKKQLYGNPTTVFARQVRWNFYWSFRFYRRNQTGIDSDRTVVSVVGVSVLEVKQHKRVFVSDIVFLIFYMQMKQFVFKDLEPTTGITVWD